MTTVQDVITLHAVFNDHTTLMEVHTHGLENYGHMNFAVYCSSLFFHSASKLLNSLASAIINKGEVFKTEENCDWDEWGGFTLKEGTDEGDLPVLRINPVNPECSYCGKED